MIYMQQDKSTNTRTNTKYIISILDKITFNLQKKMLEMERYSNFMFMKNKFIKFKIF